MFTLSSVSGLFSSPFPLLLQSFSMLLLFGRSFILSFRLTESVLYAPGRDARALATVATHGRLPSASFSSSSFPE